jgi:hypothetical protein
MGFADTYFETMEIARRPTLEIVSRLDVAAIARPWLVMLYRVIETTESLLQFAKDDLWCRAPDHNKHDAGSLLAYFERKLEDERGHAQLFWADLQFVGVTASDLGPVNPFVAEMVGRQFYLIEFCHPAAYLGYIGLLEGFPPTLEQIDELEKASGLPPAAFRTARLHAAVDVKHREELAAMLDAVPAHLRTHILANGIRCAQLQRQALEILSPMET